MKAEDLIDITSLTAAQALAALQDGRTSAEELVAGCLARIRADEDRVQAWAFIDEKRALEQARNVDRIRREGHAMGPLHGLPVGVKDIVDTADMPTEDGTVLHAGRRPDHDASVVERLRSAGAIILGKTVTTELATYAPGKTRNPVDPAHTPGGSSSGSAAAVAAHMVPAAIGTQTNGSVIRPAAYCGVYGYKPTFGLVPRHG
ncbi:MAG: amidase, partial [Pseudomonadota bacterium]|nr:amidase [Pseudomonadota bacterium]